MPCGSCGPVIACARAFASICARSTTRNIWSASQKSAAMHDAVAAPQSQMKNGSFEGTWERRINVKNTNTASVRTASKARAARPAGFLYG